MGNVGAIKKGERWVKRDICQDGGGGEREKRDTLNLQLLVELNSDFEEETSYSRRRRWWLPPSLVHQMLRVADFPACLPTYLMVARWL